MSDKRQMLLDSEQISRFFTLMMPHLVVAGDFALRLQDQLPQRDAKDGNAWTSVLTDADMGVQHYIEAVVLAELGHCGFYGEEAEHSFNTKYFPRQFDYMLSLDPINGTRLYRDGTANFDIILSLSRGGELLASMCYLPAFRVFYGADRYNEAFLASAQTMNVREPITLNNRSMSLAVYQGQAFSARLPAEVEVFDLLKDYDADDVRCDLNSVFTNELGGFLIIDTPLLDVGATAFILSRCGGLASLPDGSDGHFFDQFDARREARLLACANPRLHAIVSEALRT